MDSLMLTTITTISVIMWLVVGPAAANKTLNDAAEMIIRTCNCTEHQELCRQSLAPHALLILDKPCHLAYVAVNVTLADAKNVSQYVRGLKADYTNNRKITAALDDCAENLDGMVDEIRDSLNETRWLFANNSSQGKNNFEFHVSDLETWMSAALTDDDTCADELEYFDEPLRSHVANGTSRIQSLVSNALALINSTYYGKRFNYIN